MSAIIGNKVELQLLTTLVCNLKCSYCSMGVGDVINSQKEIKYTLPQLDKFIDTHLKDKDTYVTFYGGEPTLNQSMMEAVISRYPHFRFQLQTNGTLLDQLPDWVLGSLDNILVSVDGGEQTTDGYRGAGVYQKVMRQVQTIFPRVKGSITARMTWSNPNTTFEEIDELLSHFDYLYFQFVAENGAYSTGMARRHQVIYQMLERFFTGDTFYPIIPIMGMVRNIIFPELAQEGYDGQTQCRASTHLINVMPDGKIFACPDMMYMPEMQTGHVQTNWLTPSPLQRRKSMPCDSCEAFSYCRGNCIKNLHRAYVENDLNYRLGVVEPICSLIRLMGKMITALKPQEWYEKQTPFVKDQIRNCHVYQYVEVMP